MAANVPLHRPLSAIVKAVPSGDTVVLIKPQAGATGPPPELRLSLASLAAPKLAQTHGQGAPTGGVPGSDGFFPADEAGAWAARELLRKKLVGKPVSFCVDYRVAALQGRLFGSLSLPPAAGAPPPPKGGLAAELVSAGLARLRRHNPENERAADYDALVAAEDAAVTANRGIHNKVPGAAPVQPHRRVHLPFASSVDAEAYVASVRGKTLDGIVDHVINGAVLRVLIKDADAATGESDPTVYRAATVSIAGVICPGFRRPEGSAPPGAGAPPALIPMPFALNAKVFTESRVLHRDVRLSLGGVDKSGMLLGTVSDPLSLGEELLRRGFARTMGYSLDSSAEAPALRAAERTARNARLAVWKDWVPPTTGAVAPTGGTETWAGRVVEIVSGDMLSMVDERTPAAEPRRLSLASIRAPRLGRGAERDAPGAYAARELLRKRLIGRRVMVTVEYTRVLGAPGTGAPGGPAAASVGASNAPKGAPPPAGRSDVMMFVSLKRDTKEAEDVGLMLVKAGLATVTRHRGDEARAGAYEEYLAVACPPSTRRVFGPGGVLKETVPGEALGDEAHAFARDTFLQRDVDIYIESCDRTGAFLGTFLVPSADGKGGDDAAQMLLAAGYGKLHPAYYPAEDPNSRPLVAAAASAKAAGKGVWKNYHEPTAAELAEAAARAAAARAGPTVVGRVVDVGFAGKLCVQTEAAARQMSGVEAALAACNLDGGQPSAAVRTGEVLAAKWNGDWYRAKVLAAPAAGDGPNAMAWVRFLDYGNEDWVAPKDLRPLNAATPLGAMAPLAVVAAVDAVMVPGEGHEVGRDAGLLLRELAMGRRVRVANGDAVVVADGEPASGSGSGSGSAGGSSAAAAPAVVVNGAGDDAFPTLPTAAASSSRRSAGKGPAPTPPAPAAAPAPARPSGGSSASLAEQLLQAGLARNWRRQDAATRAVAERYRDAEDVGRRTRKHIWRYGDAYASDEDDDEETQAAHRRRYGP
ncbi:hypothetical protein BU14_0027s0058 [Porphyra umbilicalis]|uniref:Uncharacterized protein n=1 Tax=Porphyra umbilicalis TaxID=2786 RepID=A0A1X6PJI4_PORUM|nr:hypothetical protein BU14_0027s0058 [Porphyra umbilicalis]|eukprot:OSX81032.1 hypothetical protein BU14_0027s0058 [Porphyra umbilicalis]